MKNFGEVLKIESGISSFNAYPKPANEEATDLISSDKEEGYNIRLMGLR